MQTLRPLLLFLLFATKVFADTRLDHSKVGVYGTLFDFCDYSVFKFIYKDPETGAQSLPRWQKMLADTAAQQKLNLVLLYTFDRMKHARPMEEYIRNTDAVLSALDLKTIYAICLSEENVTWNNGLKVLNTLYDHIKEHYPLSVYQWLTMPDLPHPRLRADGWIIDPYGFDRTRFRRYLQKYLATGKPVINCVWASPAHSGLAFDDTPAQQVEICREFNVPVFFYAVDTRWGCPEVWLRSEDPTIVIARNWVLKVVSETHREGARGLPLESANFSTGRPIEVAGNEKGDYEFIEDFATEDFLDDATIRGFLGLVWDGAQELLVCNPQKARLHEVELQYHFTSPFQMSGVRAELAGDHPTDNSSSTFLGLSENGHQWSGTVEAKHSGKFTLMASLQESPTFPGREFWVRITVKSGLNNAGTSVLERLRVVCRTALPERREVRLEPDAEGKVTYVEDFASRKYLHLAEIQGGETLEWRRGGISTHGIKGRVNEVTLKWKFVCEKPVRNIKAVIEGEANAPFLGAVNVAGLSADGKNILVSDSTAGKAVNPRAQGWYKDPLLLDAASCPEFQGARQFYLHLTMRNASGNRTNASNRITRFQISAFAQ